MLLKLYTLAGPEWNNFLQNFTNFFEKLYKLFGQNVAKYFYAEVCKKLFLQNFAEYFHINLQIIYATLCKKKFANNFLQKFANFFYKTFVFFSLS